MIEMVYNGKETQGQDEVRLPKNIRQIGDNNSRKKVYVEDYVMTQLKKNPKNEESIRYGVLLGDSKKVKGYSYIFVKGMVEVKDIIENSLIFNDEIWSEIYKDIKRYFDALEIVGWYVSVPYRVKDDMSGIKKIHLDNFAGNDKVCFLSDRTEKEDGFYVYESGNLNRQSGYFIYYEKNERMKKYLKEKNSMENSTKQSETVNEVKNKNTENKNAEKKKTGSEAKNQEAKPQVKVAATEQKNNDNNQKETFGAPNLRNVISGKKKAGTDKNYVIESTEKEGRTNRVALGVSAMLIVALLLSTIVMLNNYGELKNIKSSLENMNDNENAQAVNQIISSLTTTEETSESKKAEDNKTSDNESKSAQETVAAQTIDSENNNSDTSTQMTEAATKAVEETEEVNGGVGIYGGALHTVTAGQTLYDISMTYYGNSNMVEQIKALNQIGDDYKIIEGQKIKLP